MVKMAVGAGTDSNANPGLKRRARPAPGVAPAMLAAPGLSGPALVGAALRVDPGVWGGVPAPAVTPRWRRNRVDVPGATALDYVSVAADDGADLDCVVTASNAYGTASAVTEAVRVVHPAPAVAGALADLVLDQGQGARTLDASGAFAGASLAFGVAGAGASVDPATGLVSIPLDDARAAETVTVTATNSGGSASVSFTVTVIAGPVGTPPVSIGAPSLSGSGRVGTPVRVDAGTWSGVPAPVVTVRWQRDDAYIPGATATEYVPVTADEGGDLRCVVVARNDAGTEKATTGAVRVVHAPPSVREALPDLVLDQGGGIRSVASAQAFAGEGLTFGVAGPGVTVDPAIGLLGVDTGQPRAGERVTVTASNSGGSVSNAFTLTVNAASPVVTIAMAPPVLVPESLRASRLAVRLEPAVGTEGAEIAGFDLRHAQTAAPGAVVGDGGETVFWQVLPDAGTLAKVDGLTPGHFVHLQCRAVTEAGPGAWSETLSIALAPAEMPVFLDTFSTGANAVSAAARAPDLGEGWTPIASGRLDLRQPQGRAVPAGSQSGTPQIDGRSFRGMWFDGGYWGRDGGTIEIVTEFAPGDRMTVIMGYRDPLNFVALRMRASSSAGSISLSRIEAGGASVIYSTAPTTLRPPPVGAPVTVRVTLTGGRVSLNYDDGDDVLPNSATVILPGSGWGVGGDQSNPQPQYFDSVKFYDVAIDAFTENADRQPPGLATFVNRTPGVQIEDLG